ncbi:hypothetical protein BH10PSE17_BH10PSE17_18360 [soil metagenome]
MQVAFSTPLQYVQVSGPLAQTAAQSAIGSALSASSRHHAWGRVDWARTVLARAAERRRHWVRNLSGRGFGGNSLGPTQVDIKSDADWARFDAPTFLRRGIVIDGLPDWRLAGDRS